MSSISNPSPAGVTVTQTVIGSGTVRNSNDTDRSTALLVYTKLKQVLVNAALTQCIISFTIGATPIAIEHRGWIYKNGVAAGTQRIQGNCGATNYQETFNNLALGDLIQIYAYTSDGGEPVHITDMRFGYSADDDITKIDNIPLATVLETTDTRDPTISMTNQDP